jgi:hypothetical protein
MIVASRACSTDAWSYPSDTPRPTRIRAIRDGPPLATPNVGVQPPWFATIAARVAARFSAAATDAWAAMARAEVAAGRYIFST